jgi:hypothetical protein
LTPAWNVVVVPVPSIIMTSESGQGPRLKECEEQFEHCNNFYVIVENIGNVASSGEVTVTDELPPGLSPLNSLGSAALKGQPRRETSCNTQAVSCTYSRPIVPGGFVVMRVVLQATSSATVLANRVTVSGGGRGQPVTQESTIRLGKEDEQAAPGIGQFAFDVTGAAGEPYEQAAGHPQLVTTSFVFNSLIVEHLLSPGLAIAPVKNLVFYLPLGFLGNPQSATYCAASLVEVGSGETGCPSSSRLGTILPIRSGVALANTSDPTNEYGIYNIKPENDYAAEFAFGFDGITLFMYANVVRHDDSYVLRVSIPGVPVTGKVIGAIATFFGDIAEQYTVEGTERTRDAGAFLTDPSDCSAPGPLDAEIEADTWENPQVPLSRSGTAYKSIEGCGVLGFSPSIVAQPSRAIDNPGTTQTDEPSAYELGVTVPQAPNGAFAFGTPPLKSVSVTLPEGVTMSPAAANGLTACVATGPNGIDIPSGSDPAWDASEGEIVGADGLARPVAGHCPISSELGTVHATTPLLSEELTGHLYLAQPGCGAADQPTCTSEDAANGKLFSLYLELEAVAAGVVIKLPGKASVDPATGRITASFDEAPQFPVSNIVVATNGGPRAPLANPQQCGDKLSTAEIEPWSQMAGEHAAASSASFVIDWDDAGGACPATLPFAPAFTAGTTHDLAGAFSPFTFTLTRQDREQNVASVSTTLPEGLLASIAHVPRCPEPQASRGECLADSQVGTTTVGVGSGSDPYYVTGNVYFTDSYDGAPFGLSVVIPAVAGPFNLGDVVVRVALRIDPHTAQVTAESSAFPEIIDGVPLRIRTVNVTLNAKEFTFNPTSCAQLQVTGTVKGGEGGEANVSSPFAAAGCKNLPFSPKPTVSTEAKSTKADGTGVKIKIAYPPGGGQANVAKVTIDFPRQLPVRITTIRRACQAAMFEVNPAACPVGSNIGIATVHTPILSQPLTGPAYLVSYGNTKWPDVVFVLQGEGVKLDVTGESFISRSGVLKVTFSTVPDAPFASFETTLSRGQYSQFTNVKTTSKATFRQCGEKLVAPTTIIAQNGRQITQATTILVNGCRKAKKMPTKGRPPRSPMRKRK